MFKSLIREPRTRRLSIDPLVPLWLVLPVVAWIGHGFANGVTRDVALYVQAGQAVADGEPPYVGVWNRAGPLAHLLPGLGVTVARLVGAEDVTGARLLYFAMAALTPVFVYVTVRTVFGSRIGGCVGAATMVSYPIWAHFSTSGPDSKQPMVVFLALALMLTVQRRMLLAGVATALATLTWQPVFVAAALAALVMGLTADGGRRGRFLALGRYALGGLATLAATVLYFVAAGAFGDFVDAFWRANAGYTDQPPLLAHLPAVWAGLQHWFGWTLWLLIGGCVASLVVAALLLRRPPAHSPLAEARAGALATGAATLGAVGWSFYAFNAAPDAFLVLPVAAVGLGNGAALLGHAVAHLVVPRAVLAAAVAGFVLAAVALTAVEMVTTAKNSLLDGRRMADAVFDELPEDATAFVVEVPQPLALAERRSISPYLLYTAGITKWIDDTYPGGLTAYVAWVRGEEPDVVFTRSGPMPRPFTTLRSDYFPVARANGWRVWVHVDVDEEARERMKAELRAARQQRAGQ